MTNLARRLKKQIERNPKIKSFNFEWPEQLDDRVKLRDVLEDSVDQKHYLTDDKIERISNWKARQKPLENIRDLDDISPCLTARGAGNNHAGMVIVRDAEGRLRNPSPLECFRLQDFPDDAYYAVKDAGISDSQAYKMTGNAVTVSVIRAIGERLLPLLDA